MNKQTNGYSTQSSINPKRLGDAMISVVDRVFEPWTGQVEDYTILHGERIIME